MTGDSKKTAKVDSFQTSLSIPAAHFAPPLPPSRPVTSPPPASTGLGPADVVGVLRHWWWQCLLAGCVLTCLASAIVWFTFTPMYEATAWIEIKEQPLYVAFEPRTNPNSKLFFQTQLQTIRSPVVLGRVALDPQIASLPEARDADSVLDWLQRNLNASFRGESELCEITFRSRQADTAAKVANAVMEAYLNLQRDQLGEQTDRIIRLLNAERMQRRAELEQLQERVRTLAKKVTGQDPGLGGGQREVVVVQNPVGELETRRTAVEVERVVLEAQLHFYQEQAAQPVEAPPEEVELVLDAHPEVLNLKTQILQQRAKVRDRQRRTSSAENPVVKQLTATLDDLERALEDLRTELRPKISEEIKVAIRTQRARAVTELEAKIANHRELEQAWAKRVEEQRKKSERAGDQSVELEFARSDLLRCDEVFRKISDRIVALRTEMSAPSRTSELKRATAPLKPLEAIPLKRMGMAGFLTMALPFGLALLWERRQRRICNAQQVAIEANLHVLGEITALPKRSLLSGKVLSNQVLQDRLTFEESVDSLRVGLTQSPHFRELHTLAVTSAVSREGKTSLSYSLALSLSRCTDQLTLLIDGDMRAPDLHVLCEIPCDPGLAEVLDGAATVDEAIVPYAAERIHLLPAGRLRTSPHLLLKNNAFDTLLESLRGRYRYIVIDCPPVLAASETVVLASAAEGTLLCTMRDVSRAPQLRLTCQKLVAGGAKLLGAVISGVPIKTWVYKYGGYGYTHQRYANNVPHDTSNDVSA